MRLIHYLNESKTIIKDFSSLRKKEKEIIKLIEGNCKPFLKEFSNPLYRGTIDYSMFIKKTRRKDRKPKDLQKVLHETLDEIFYDLFGWYPRSEGVFVTSDPSQARSYGESFYFFPIGKYRYVYSNRVYDLYSSLNSSMFNYIRGDVVSKKEQGLPGYEAITQDVYDMIEKTIKELYSNKGLNFDISGRFEGEVQFDCNEYYLLKRFYKSQEESNFIDSVVQELGFDV